MRQILFVVMLLLVALAAPSLTAQPPDTPARPTAFVDVNVIPMDTERVLAHQTVVVQDGRVAALGPVAEVVVPADAQVIAGAGGYLMPGLADMHVHLSFDADPAHLQLYLAQGVTTVRNYNADPIHRTWRDQVNAGSLVGPTIFTSGPSIIGIPPSSDELPYLGAGVFLFGGLLVGLIIWLLLKLLRRLPSWGTTLRYGLGWLALVLVLGTVVYAWQLVPVGTFVTRRTISVVDQPEHGRRAVAAQSAQGYDFIKPYSFLNARTYHALMDEARARNLYTSGHLPDAVPLADALAAGQDELAHLEEYEAFFRGAEHNLAQSEPIAAYSDPTRFAEAVALSRAHGARVVSTMVTIDTLARLASDTSGLLQQPQYRVVRPALLTSWRTEGRGVEYQDRIVYLRDQLLPFLQRLAKALHEGGVPILVGTDVGVEGLVPGDSLHRELGLLVGAGFSPFDALSGATRVAAEATQEMNGQGDWGTVAVGKRADLVLLAANPLDDIAHTRERQGVMVRGRWYAQAELERMVDEFVATYNR